MRNRSRWGYTARWVAATVCLFATTGCFANVMALPYFLFAGDPSIRPPVKLCEGKRDAKRIVVIPYTSDNLRWTYDAVDEEVGRMLINLLVAGDSRYQIVPERRVRDWKDKEPNAGMMGMQEIGEHFDVDYVVYFEVDNFTINETRNQFLLKGKTDISFRVHDVNKNMLIYKDVYQREYPPNREVQLTEFSSEDEFQQRFLRVIAMELSWYLVRHQSSDEIIDL